MNEMPIEKKELKIENFIDQVGNKNILDDTIFAMFLDIHNEGDKEKIAEALRVLEHGVLEHGVLEYKRPDVALKAAVYAKNNIEKNQVNLFSL